MQSTHMEHGDTACATAPLPPRPKRSGRVRAAVISIAIATAFTSGILHHQETRPVPAHVVNVEQPRDDAGALGSSVVVGTDEKAVAAIEAQADRRPALELDNVAATARLHGRQQEREAERATASVPDVVPPASFHSEDD